MSGTDNIRVSFYPFTKEQLLKVGEPGFVDRNISHAQLVNFIIKNDQINKAEADSIEEECVYATRIGESPIPFMQYLAGRFEFESLEDIKGSSEFQKKEGTIMLPKFQYSMKVITVICYLLMIKLSITRTQNPLFGSNV